MPIALRALLANLVTGANGMLISAIVVMAG